jgi:hypothetical protein
MHFVSFSGLLGRFVRVCDRSWHGLMCFHGCKVGSLCAGMVNIHGLLLACSARLGKLVCWFPVVVSHVFKLMFYAYECVYVWSQRLQPQFLEV